jgi:protein-disulfide isomerase
VRGTPTIFVNGRPTPSMPSYEVLSAMIDRELEG